jgi:HEAT repeat protein
MRNAGWLWLGLLVVAACGKDRVASDITALRTADAPARRAAAQSLANQQDPRIAPALAAALKDGDPEVRCAAAHALGSHEPDVAVPALLALLATTSPSRTCTYEPLGHLHDARAAVALVREAAGGRNEPALAAVRELGAPATGALIGALRTEGDPKYVDVLAHTLITVDKADALQPLLGLIVEYDRTANANAAYALGLLGDPRALPALTKAADSGIGTAARAMARVGKPGVEALLGRLGHRSEMQRRAAADALAQASDPAVVTLLEAELRGSDAALAANSARILARMAGAPLDGAAAGPALPLQAAATAALDRAWQQRDLRAIAAGVEYFLRRHPDGEDTLIDALEMQGNEALATAFVLSSSPALRAAGAEWRKQSGLPPVPPAPASDAGVATTQ